MYTIYELSDKSFEDLKMIAIELGIDDEGRTKQQLIYDIIDHQVEHPESVKRKPANNEPKKRGRKPKAQNAENAKTAPTPKTQEIPFPKEEAPKEAPKETPKENTQETPKEPAKVDSDQKKRGRRPRIAKDGNAPKESATCFLALRSAAAAASPM